MGDAKRTIIVHARKTGKGYKFGMSGYGVGGPDNEEIRCKKNGMKSSAKNEVVFEIANHGKSDLLFPTNPDRAMWVGADGQTCPGSQPPAPHNVIVPTNVSSDRERLTVKNSNPAEERYKFSLNFVERGDTSQQTLYQYDPIWDNQNGGSQRR